MGTLRPDMHEKGGADGRIEKEELARRLAGRMQTDSATASAWIDGVVQTLYESFKAGERVTLRCFGSFYVREERSS